MHGWSESRQHVVAHRHGGREVRLARGGIREHEAFLGHEMRGGGPAGIGHSGVSMAEGWQEQGEERDSEDMVRSHHLPSPPCFFRLYLCISAFCLDNGGCYKTSVLCTHIHEFSHISHSFHSIYFLVRHIFDT